MVDEDSHSTDLSVSGEEGLSTILLAHYIFWYCWFSVSRKEPCQIKVQVRGILRIRDIRRNILPKL